MTIAIAISVTLALLALAGYVALDIRLNRRVVAGTTAYEQTQAQIRQTNALVHDHEARIDVLVKRANDHYAQIERLRRHDVETQRALAEHREILQAEGEAQIAIAAVFKHLLASGLASPAPTPKVSRPPAGKSTRTRKAARAGRE